MPVFVALMIPDERLVRVGEYFEKYGYHVVDVSMLHLTLLFIGDYRGVYLHRISEILSDVEVEVPGVLKPVGISLLPPSKATNIVVLINDNDGRLARMRKVVEKRISKYFKISDRYEFVPHITIAKRLRPLDKNRYAEVSVVASRLSRILPEFLVVRDICLIETLEGGKYRCVARLKTRWI